MTEETPLLREYVTAAETAAGALDPPKLERLRRAFEADGVVVLCDVIPHPVLDHIATQLDFAAAHYVATDKGHERGAQGGFPRDGSRPGLQICSGIARQAPWVCPELVANPIIEQVAQAVLGLDSEIFIRYFNCNSSCPGSGAQMIHQDAGHAWQTEEAAAAAGEVFPHRATRIFVNFGVDAMTPENGSTQLWPGTHLLPQTADPRWPEGGWYHEAELDTQRGTWQGNEFFDYPGFTTLVDEQRRRRPPVQLSVPKGGVAIRDNRCWHAGRPNHTPWPRHMFGLGYMRYLVEGDPFAGDQNGCVYR